MRATVTDSSLNFDLNAAWDKEMIVHGEEE